MLIEITDVDIFMSKNKVQLFMFEKDWTIKSSLKLFH